MDKPDAQSKGVTLDLKKDVHKVAPEASIAFFQGIMPFNELDDETLRKVAHYCRIDFFPKGTRLLSADETEITHLFLIQKGGVKAFIIDDEGEVTLKDYRGEGSYIGALGIIRGTKANLNIETIEDTFCYLLPREVFLGLVQNHPTFSHYFLKSFSEKVVQTAYRELRHHKVGRRSMEDLYLFSIKAEALVKELRTVSSSSSIQEAARAMAHYSIGSLLIHDPQDTKEIVGIVTDRDLRSKVVSAGLDYQENVATIMSSPVLTVSSETLCFDVLLKMMSTGIHHLAVERAGIVIGVITTHDITVLQGNSPFYLFKEIVAQQSIAGLYPLAEKIPGMIRNLIREGGKASKITRMIAILNDQIVDRLLTLLENEMGPPPVSYSWILFGSEGRWEQTFKTDQDNGIIYCDPKDEEEKAAAAQYFQEFGKRAIDSLINCGYPLCPQEVMASNSRWCQPFSVWKAYFSRCAQSPENNELNCNPLFFDFRSGHGDETLVSRLRDHLIELAQRNPALPFYLTRRTTSNRVPLSFFNNFIVERDGAHKNKLDIKSAGIMPYVDFARILSLKYGLRETNTMARLQAVDGGGFVDHELIISAIDSYELQMQLRLVHQLEQLEGGVLPDNHIDPANLSELERKMLKEAFSIIEELYGVLLKLFPVM